MKATTPGRTIPCASIISMGIIRWKLAEVLKKHGLTAYRLATTLNSHTRAPTIYRLAKPEVTLSRVDFAVLAVIIEGLTELTGETIGVADLLEYQKEV